MKLRTKLLVVSGAAMLFGCILYAVTVQREMRVEGLRAVEMPAPATVTPAPSALPDQIDLLHEEWRGVSGQKQKEP